MADIRDLYQAKQAAGKTKRIIYDETKNRDESNIAPHIRAYPMVASNTSEQQPNSSQTNLALNQTSSISIHKKG